MMQILEKVYKYFVLLFEYWQLRPSHTTTEIAKNAVIFHSHFNILPQLQQFFDSLYMGNGSITICI